MDALYLFKHSQLDDLEIRYSLRSLEAHAPYIRKVWIFGDKPKFLVDNTSIIEHVPHSAVARVLNVKVPVTNFFLMLFLSSLIPGLDFEYLCFSDDFFLMHHYPIASARQDRYYEDLTKATQRMRNLWADSIWRTYDYLMLLGYAGYNFETHTPTYFTRKRVMDAYCDLQDYITEDKHYGMAGFTAILNHAMKHEKFKPIPIQEEKSRFGYWTKPPTYEEVVRDSQGKTFFNFNEEAFGEGIRKFLMERFPVPSRFEKG